MMENEFGTVYIVEYRAAAANIALRKNDRVMWPGTTVCGQGFRTLVLLYYPHGWCETEWFLDSVFPRMVFQWNFIDETEGQHDGD